MIYPELAGIEVLIWSAWYGWRVLIQDLVRLSQHQMKDFKH